MCKLSRKIHVNYHKFNSKLDINKNKTRNYYIPLISTYANKFCIRQILIYKYMNLVQQTLKYIPTNTLPQNIIQHLLVHTVFTVNKKQTLKHHQKSKHQFQFQGWMSIYRIWS